MFKQIINPTSVLLKNSCIHLLNFNLQIIIMKKLVVLGLSSFLILSSCKSDDDGGSGVQGPTQPTVNGSLSVEEGKQQLENNAVDLLNKVESFKSDTALNEIIELAEFLTADNASAKQLNGFQATAVNSIANVASAKEDIIAANVSQTSEISQKTTVEELNDEKGIYNWNPALENGEGGFEKTGDSDDIIYNIAYNNKNAVFSFTEFSSVQAKNDTEVPTKAVADLKINGVTVFSQNYTASIDAGKTVPNSINNTTFIGGFSFVTSYVNNNNTSITQSFDFKIGDEVITGYNYTANGNLSTVENEDTELLNVLNNAAVSLKFLNATLAITAKDDNFDSNADLTIDQQIALLNSNITSELIIGDKSIAKGQFYKDQETTQIFPVFETPEPGEDVVFPEPTTVTNDIINARFLFADGTTTDFDTYFDNAFTDAENKFETVINAYEKLFNNIDLGSDDDDVFTVEEPTIETTTEVIE